MPSFLLGKNKILVFSYFSMEILTTSTSNQSLKIIPRADASSPTLSLYDKSTRTVVKTSEDDYMVLTGTFSLKEGNQYTFRVKDGSTEIYRGLIFCTDQSDLDKYFANSGEYVEEDSYDNDFVVI